MKISTNNSGKWTRHSSSIENGAIKILESADSPLSLKEIISKMLDEGLVVLNGKTPHRSLYAIILRKDSKRIECGKPALFNKIIDGRIAKYTLNKK